ncbi:hypothetical protein FKP32DRAFT_1596047 [Trametes sanguinea]|nr:hypothetical protein FKP32DRAFT_1596047 [Trametes sanguinea]
MKFFALVPVLTAVAFGAVSVVAQGSTAILSGFEVVTELSDSTRADAKAITPSNSAVQFPVVLQDLDNIIMTAKQLFQTIRDSETLDEEAAKAVAVAVTSFVKAQRALLNVIIGKHSVASRPVSFIAEVATVLHPLQANILSLDFAVAGVMPNDLKADYYADARFKMLRLTFRNAMSFYSL